MREAACGLPGEIGLFFTNSHRIATDNINMDEVMLTFDMPMARTVEVKGADTVTIHTTGNEKTHVSVMLACCALGDKLPPMPIFKRKNSIKEELPAGVVVTHKEMDESDCDEAVADKILWKTT